jgi:hypothetical protein
MKKVSMGLLFTLVTIISYGQEFKKVFLGKDWNTYKGLHLKYKVGTIGGTTHNFYSSQPTKSFQSPVYGKTKQYDFVTDTNSIKDRDFLVVNVTPFNTSVYQNRNALFELNDGKETLYFIYDSQYDFNFPFEVKGFNYSADYLSKDIEKDKDDFTDVVKFRTPLGNDMSIIKVMEGARKPIYYLNLETRGSTLNYNKKGVIVLFKDGTKWAKPEEEIDVKVVNGDGWGYRAFITLTEQDLQMFSTKEVDKFRLYIYDNQRPDDTDKFVFYTQAIVKMK